MSDISCKWNQKKAGVAILVSDKYKYKYKYKFKSKVVKKKSQENHYIIMNSSIQKVEIKIRCIYAPNNRSLRYIQ